VFPIITFNKNDALSSHHSFHCYRHASNHFVAVKSFFRNILKTPFLVVANEAPSLELKSLHNNICFMDPTFCIKLTS
jgi:hypothetical protein